MGLLHSHSEPSSERKTHSHSPTSHSHSKNHKSFLGQNSHGYTFALPRTEQQNEERKGFSTAVSGSYNHGHGSHNIFAYAKNTISASSSTYKFEENEMTRLENSPDAANVVYGQEVLLSEAASLVKKSNDNNANENHTQQAVDVKHFDKILILLEHGEAHAVIKEEEKLSFGTTFIAPFRHVDQKGLYPNPFYKQITLVYPLRAGAFLKNIFVFLSTPWQTGLFDS